MYTTDNTLLFTDHIVFTFCTEYSVYC